MHATPAFLDALRTVVGPTNVVTDPSVTAGYVRDWTGRWVGNTPAVVRPASTPEVAEVLRLCLDAGVNVVPQGGNTGLVGGGVPLAGEILLSLARLQRLDPVDRLAAQVTAGAGVPLARLRRHAESAGLEYAIDLAARDTATVGGTVATNAGGLHVMRYGATREQVRGVEVVLADGSVISRLGGLVKDNTGYDLAGLVCGSEGTLAVVTAARLRLVPRYEARVTALLAFDDADAALETAAVVRDSLDALEAVEFFDERGLGLVCERLDLARPFVGPHEAYLLVEAAGHRDPTDDLADVIAAIDAVRDAAVAGDPSRRAALWRYREGHTEAINLLGPPHKFDVTLPATGLVAFAHDVAAAVDALASDATCWLFGHAADGNLHVNVTGLAPDDEEIDDVVYDLVDRHHGSISAEHGIGTAKRRWLHLVRSPVELAVFRAVKDALDPRGILNPHALLPDR